MHQMPETAADPVAHNGAADFLGNGKTDTDRLIRYSRLACHDKARRDPAQSAFLYTQKIAAFAQRNHRGGRRGSLRQQRICELCHRWQSLISQQRGRTGGHGPWRDDGAGRYGHRLFPCAHGSHVYGYGEFYLADKCVSWSNLVN